MATFKQIKDNMVETKIISFSFIIISTFGKYHIKILLGDFNVKIGGEDIFQ